MCFYKINVVIKEGMMLIWIKANSIGDAVMKAKQLLEAKTWVNIDL